MTTIDITERRIPVYKLIAQRGLLVRMDSFREEVIKCNFNVSFPYSSITGGKYEVYDHDSDDHRVPIEGRLVLELHHVRLTDHVVLTENQYKDYRAISALD